MSRGLMCGVLTAALCLHAASVQAGERVALATSGLGSEQSRDVEKALRAKGYQVVDASRPYETLLGGMLPGLTLLGAPVPSWWPPALRNDWEEGQRACRATAGDPPYPGPRMLPAVECGEHLGGALWQKWLAQQKATRVLFIQLRTTSPGTPGTLEVSGYEAEEPRTRSQDATVENAADVARLATTLALEILDDRGATEPRRVFLALPIPPAGTPKELPPPEYEAVPVPAGCTALPADLVVEPKEEPFSAVLTRRWRKSVQGAQATAAPLSCRLELKRQVGPVLGGGDASFSNGKLSCGEQTIPFKVTSMVVSLADEKLSRELVLKLLQARCGGAPGK
ncbi:MAG TPA: hypothetical protein VK447_01290 [Myxococcaceae bacterium]|nr:hypothetical protein [Myxococcaceae bacterium]